MLNFEDQFYDEKCQNIAGCDEAGRGPLLGPVVAAAVILPKDFNHPLINDSKQLSEKKRNEAYKIIMEHALSVGVGIIDADEIDKINIYEASRKAMKLALNKLDVHFDLVLTDAMPLPYEEYQYIDIIKGDAKARCIAASSIVAKVLRDKMMDELDEKYPMYNIKKHKGYGTKLHMEALEKYGPIEGVHRKSFKPIKKFFEEKITLF